MRFKDYLKQSGYRLFHGTVEGHPGLTVDRYGPLLLAQTFHRPLSAEQLTTLETFYASAFPALPLLWNDRSARNSRIANPLPAAQQELAASRRTFSELGVRYHFQARHDGQDPWLFLDLRAARRRVRELAAGRSVLNVFAYTCGVGIAAARLTAQGVGPAVPVASNDTEEGRARNRRVELVLP